MSEWVWGRAVEVGQGVWVFGCDEFGAVFVEFMFWCVNCRCGARALVCR